MHAEMLETLYFAEDLGQENDDTVRKSHNDEETDDSFELLQIDLEDGQSYAWL